MALIPSLKSRSDDLFVEWLFEPDVQTFMQECLQFVKLTQHSESELDSPLSANQLWTSLSSTSQQQILGLGMCSHCNVFHARTATSSNRPTSARYGNGSNKLSIHLNSPLAPLPSPRSPRKPLASPTDPHLLSSPAIRSGATPKVSDADQVPATIALGRSTSSADSREGPSAAIPLVAERDSLTQPSASVDQFASDTATQFAKKLSLVCIPLMSCTYFSLILVNILSLFNFHLFPRN